MNKTIKIIAIVLLALGALAVVGGVCSAVISRQLTGRGMPALNQPNNPHFKGGDRPMKDGRNLPGPGDAPGISADAVFPIAPPPETTLQDPLLRLVEIRHKARVSRAQAERLRNSAGFDRC